MRQRGLREGGEGLDLALCSSSDFTSFGDWELLPTFAALIHLLFLFFFVSKK